MKKVIILCFGIVFGMVVAVPNKVFASNNFSGVASVNVTSDTAANAKNIAFDEAYRQIITEVLKPYTIPDQLAEALGNSKSSDLATLVEASSIDSEKVSDTTYSANITVRFNKNLLKNWMQENNVQNWLNDEDNIETMIVFVNLTSNPVADWMQLKEVSRDENISFDTKYMTSSQAMIEIPKTKSVAFGKAVREKGWNYADREGIVHLWKLF